MHAADTDALTARIDAVLPQTQCTQCGYDGCLPYARAIAQGDAPINRCPPGGDAGVAALAGLLNQPVIALDASCGAPGPLTVAVIDERHCIGCTLCINACPVDAIAGANKRMHTVIPDWCTGCGLCVPPCPVDCIVMAPAGDKTAPAREWTRADADAARRRHHARAIRLQVREQDAQARLAARSAPVAAALPEFNTESDTESDSTFATTSATKHAVIAAALARARARRAQSRATP